MIPQRVPGTLDSQQAVCEFAGKWMLSYELAFRLQKMQELFEVGFLMIISGYREPQHQLDMIKSGDATLAPEKSTHCSCPATGADLEPQLGPAGFFLPAWAGPLYFGIVHLDPTEQVKALMGSAAVHAGLRWGGGAAVDRNGIPIKNEWRHVDLGPRSDAAGH